ncbi:hypothetical protein ACWHAM_12260 [Paenibacillus terrae]
MIASRLQEKKSRNLTSRSQKRSSPGGSSASRKSRNSKDNHSTRWQQKTLCRLHAAMARDDEEQY